MPVGVTLKDAVDIGDELMVLERETEIERECKLWGWRDLIAWARGKERGLI